VRAFGWIAFGDCQSREPVLGHELSIAELASGRSGVSSEFLSILSGSLTRLPMSQRRQASASKKRLAN
jgi:hypothetical protein